jgi:hypothetical protein
MRTGFALLILVLAGFALAGATCRHEIVTPEPIKIEITIRQEIHEYVHQVNDAVAGKVSAEEAADALFSQPKPDGGGSLLRGIEGLFVNVAYAAEDDARAKFVAALKGRQDRYATVQQYLRDGSAGENHMGLLSFRETPRTKSDGNYANAVHDTINKENADRETMIAIIAAQKGVAVSLVREEQFTANVAAAPSGAWIEVQQGDHWVWSQK